MSIYIIQRKKNYRTSFRRTWSILLMVLSASFCTAFKSIFFMQSEILFFSWFSDVFCLPASHPYTHFVSSEPKSLQSVLPLAHMLDWSFKAKTRFFHSLTSSEPNLRSGLTLNPAKKRNCLADDISWWMGPIASIYIPTGKLFGWLPYHRVLAIQTSTFSLYFALS